MYCKNCGNLLNDQDNFCVKCGSKVIKEVKPVVKQEPIKVKEKTNVGWWFLGFFIPIVGVVLFFVYRKKNSKASSDLMYGSISGVIIYLFSFAVTFVVLLASFYGPIEKGVYSNTTSTMEDNSSYEQYSELRLLDFDYNYGDFSLSSTATYNLFGDNIELYYGEVEITVNTTIIGEWELLENGYVMLVAFEKTIVCNFAGEGKDEYIRSIKDECELVYGFSFTKKLFSSQELIYTYEDGLITYASLNDRSLTFVEMWLPE